MSGIDFLADTNIILYLLEGNPCIRPFINSKLAVSVVSEIELLGWHKIKRQESQIVKELLDNCFVIELLPSIKEIAIELKQKQKIKLPDAVIAATSIYLQIPLLTADKNLRNIPDTDILLIEV